MYLQRTKTFSSKEFAANKKINNALKKQNYLFIFLMERLVFKGMLQPHLPEHSQYHCVQAKIMKTCLHQFKLPLIFAAFLGACLTERWTFGQKRLYKYGNR